MKYAETAPAALVLVVRLVLVPPGRWAIDWIAALAVLYVAIVLTRQHTPPRRWAVGLACAWLAVIYGIHQLPWMFAGWK